MSSVWTHGKWSDRLDLNQRPLPPQGSTLPDCATARTKSLPNKIYKHTVKQKTTPTNLRTKCLTNQDHRFKLIKTSHLLFCLNPIKGKLQRNNKILPTKF